MQRTNLFSKTLMSIAMLGFLLLCGITTFAVIPSNITTSYTVTGTENSLGGVSLQPSSILTITGTAANAVINGNITVSSGAELQIYSGATVTFNGNVTINPGGILRVYAYNSLAPNIKMAVGTKIILKGNPATISGNAWAHIEKARFSCATPGGFWKGFETSVTGTGAYSYVTSINMINSEIENAICAYRNYDSDNSNINATAGGVMFGAENIYRNNIRNLAIYNQTGVSVPTNALNTYNTNDKVSRFYDCKFIINAGFTSSQTPVDMVYLNNSSNIGFFNCEFRDFRGSTSMNACIYAINSGLFLQGSTYQSGLPPSRNTITNFTNGVVIYNSLQTDRVSVITNTDFSCAKSITMSGCFNPYILNCTFVIGPNTLSPFPYNIVGAYLNNCTGYKIEGNTGSEHPGGGPFIVVRNSGAAYNEIYRNRSKFSALGIEAIGINRDATGSTGLKILCNNVKGSGKGISIIKDPIIIGGVSEGVANQQYTVSGSNIVSAGNHFSQQFSQFANVWDIHVDPSLAGQLLYRYSPTVIAEQPIYNNIATLNIATTPNENTCPVRNAGATPQPFPFYLFVAQNRAIEGKINEITASAIDPSDEAVQLALDPLYSQHAKNIDAITTYYQHMAATDTTDHHDDYQDSLELVYQTVTVGYEYKIYLASAYADKGAYDRAIKTLTELPEKYKVNDDEQQYMRNLKDLFTVRQWLYLNEGNWREIPGDLKDMVYTNEKNDPMFAGAMARAILAQYEGATYDPYYVIPPMPVKQQTSKMIKGLSDSKIYPNPTTGYATIAWEGSDAILVLSNTNGQKVYQTNIKSGKNELDLSPLASGTYIAQLIVNGKQVYQQNLVKK